MKNCKNYSLYKSYIITLSYTNSKLARDHLLSILKNSNANEIIPRSLSRFNSSEVIKSIFNVYNEKNENYSYTTEILLKEISLDNITIIDAFKSSNDIDETLIYLKSTRLIEDQVFKKYFINNYRYYLNHETNIVRYEAIKTIHYLFKYEDERKIFSEHLKFETDKEIQELIYGYIGVIQ